MKKLFLIDGHALIFRMYYAFLRRPMINSKGQDTSILFGFMKYLLELIKREEPTHLAVVFDPPGKNFRHEAFPKYKANRSATPELIIEALEPLTELVKSINLPVLMISGYEADDVIGATANKAEKNGYEVYMVTPDKDLGQLVTDHIHQYKPGKSGAADEIWDKKKICDKYNIKDPKQVIDILALWGDAADNIPGVRGIGEVGSKKLIGQYGSVENIYKHLDELKPKQAEKFIENKETALLSKFLVTIKTDIPININAEDLKVEFSNIAKAKELFSKYEFRSLFNLLPFDDSAESSSTNNTKTAKTLLFKNIDIAEMRAISLNSRQCVIKIVNEKIILAAEDKIVVLNTLDEAKDILENEKILKIGYDLKEAIKVLRKHDIALKGYLADIALMHYLINPEITHSLDMLSRTYLDIDISNISASNNDLQEESSDTTSAPELEPDLFSTPSEEKKISTKIDERTKAETVITYKLYNVLHKLFLKDETLKNLYDTMEMPLLRVLADMEFEGVTIDPILLQDYSKELTMQMNKIEQKIREASNSPTLNISSPKQLGIVLYDIMKINPKVKKNKNGNYPTDEKTLNSLLDVNPIVQDILDYREIKKLVSTYINPLPGQINPETHKIHTTFNQALTATGRLSSSNPNLQNIPNRTSMGREIRKAFIPSHEDGFIVSADYSQIELRIMAALSEDPSMISDFNAGKDIHTATSAKIYHISDEEVTKEQRTKAKTANFGIIYGISSHGLSQRLHIPYAESKELISEYFKHYPAVQAYMERMKKSAKEKGYVETLFNRKRYLPNINSRNHNVMALAERNAINAPIQGTAADIIKMAMINIWKRLNEGKFKSKMVLQIHDELILDVVKEEVDEIVKIVKDEMENVIKLSVPLTVECNYGKNWLEAH